MQIPKSITREHILEALKRIDKEGYSSENKSRSYDLNYEGKNYPPKVVIAYANLIAGNNEELSYDFHGGVNLANKFLEDRGFEIISKNESKNVVNLNEIIQRYKEFIVSDNYEELYKWEVVKNFQDNWNIEAEDFAEMIKVSFQPSTCNLWAGFNYLPRKMILGMAEYNPNLVKEMFVILFDENKELEERINYFQKKASEITIKQFPGKDFNTYQDKRAIFVYLSLKYPEKYYLYKYDMYEKFCLISGLQSKPKKSRAGDNKILFDYLNLCDQVCNILTNDKELISIHNSRLDYLIHYKEANYHILTQDFIYFTAIIDSRRNNYQKMDDVKYWLISIRDYENNWDKWLNEGIAAIEFGKLGDLKNYHTREEMQLKLKELYPGDTSKTHSSLACFEFANVLKKGDVLIAKRGVDFFIGYGRVISDYYYDNDESKFKNKVRVNWSKTGEWEKIDFPIVSKILTDITKYPDYLKKIKKKIGINDVEGNHIIENNSKSTDTNISYWWLNANPSIWRIEDFEIGQEQSYTSHNDKGNKRRIYDYFKQVKPGDKIIGYESTPVKKIKAVFEVTEGLHIDDDSGKELITFRITEFMPNQLSWDELQKIQGLKDCEVLNDNQGSLFNLKENEYNLIIEKSKNERENILENYSLKNLFNEVFIEDEKIEKISQILRRKKNIILQGPPGTGKTFLAKRLAFSLLGKKDPSKIEVIQFHQSYSYEDFIQGLRPAENGAFQLKNGIFYDFSLKAQRDKNNEYFLIIDEINRGNLSKIFGELMMLIEHDKRGKEFQISLTYAPNTKFYVPENLYIIGTMNTADRSLAMVDYALRRRFSFIDMKPLFEDKFKKHMSNIGIDYKNIEWLIKGINEINEIIEQDSNLGKDYKIGHSYFCNVNNTDFRDQIINIIEFELKPLLEEYWFDNRIKVEDCIKRLR